MTRIPIHQSLLRPLLVFGGERELVLGSGLIAAVLIFSLGSFLMIAIGAIFWLVSLAALQRVAKMDPEFSRVYRRHLNRKVYYPAQAHISAIDPIIHRQQ
jgi:type IV secretion system protein TrbD